MINSGSEVNTTTPAYAAQLGLILRSTNVNTQKIDELALKTYEMTTAGFLVEDKLGRIRFFEKTFLLTDTSMKIILEIPFFLLSYVDVDLKQ